MNIGDKIRFIPDLHYGYQRDNKAFTGIVVYINEAHNWFTLEYCENGNKLRESHKFFRGMQRENRYNNGVLVDVGSPPKFQTIPGVAIF